jgi:hypothetical protein
MSAGKLLGFDKLRHRIIVVSVVATLCGRLSQRGFDKLSHRFFPPVAVIELVEMSADSHLSESGHYFTDVVSAERRDFDFAQPPLC